MTEIRFYHLQRLRLEAALPKMLERVVQRQQRAVVLAGSAERVEALAGHLWTYDDRSFLPHGTARDGHPELQPIWLTDRAENPNGADVLFMTDGAVADRLDGFALCAMLFDGRDPAAVQAARGHWAQWRDAGHHLTYWQQTGQGWERKAATHDDGA